MRRIVQHGDVDALFHQPFLQRTGDALAHVQRGLRPGFLEAFDEGRNEQPPRRRRHAERDAAALGERSSPDLVAGLLHEMRDRLGALEQQRAGGGEPHAAAVPREQRHAEFVLELPDLAAQRRLRQPQFVGRAADAAGARDAHEVAQFLQFH